MGLNPDYFLKIFYFTFTTNQPCHLQDGLEIKISVMFMTSLLFSEVFIMVEYFSKTEYVICTFRQISKVPDQTYKHSIGYTITLLETAEVLKI